MLDLVALVHRPVGLEVHDHRLGADRERAREHVEVLDRGLQVHQPLAGLVVARAQLVGVRDPRDADPLAAVERLHVERVADLLRDLRRGRTAGCTSRAVGELERSCSSRGVGDLCGTIHVAGTFRPRRIIAQ